VSGTVSWRDETGARGRRIALLSPAFWPEVRRGAERIVGELAQGLTRDGHEARIITSHSGWPSRRHEGYALVIRNWRPPDRWLEGRQFEHYLTHIPFTYSSLRRGDDDLAHAFFASDAMAAAAWSHGVGRPAIFTFTGIPDRVGLLGRRRRLGLTLRAATECSAFTVLSRAAARAAERWLGIEARVICPGVDLEAFTPGDGRAEEPTIFCPAAIDVPRKGAQPLLAAYRRVKREVPEARLVLSRPAGPFVARIEAEESGVEFADRVHEPPLLARLYRRAWVTVLPSIGEAFGIVLVESLACGTPVVGSPFGGIPEIVDRPAIGRIASTLEPADLAHALVEALNLSASESTPDACRARARDFSTEQATHAYQDLYAELLAG
jgi:phosphatidylinositol alpha-mannosyltransferase